jgi:hypothetical protein
MIRLAVMGAVTVVAIVLLGIALVLAIPAVVLYLAGKRIAPQVRA